MSPARSIMVLLATAILAILAWEEKPCWVKIRVPNPHKRAKFM